MVLVRKGLKRQSFLLVAEMHPTRVSLVGEGSVRSRLTVLVPVWVLANREWKGERRRGPSGCWRAVETAMGTGRVLTGGVMTGAVIVW